MTRTGWFLTALVAALIAASIAWVMRSIEWVEVDEYTPPRGEAARDRFYVAKQLVRRLGASVTTVHDLERLPPAGATLVIGSRRWSMFPGREAALQRWIEAGGHLVVMQSVGCNYIHGINIRVILDSIEIFVVITVVCRDIVFSLPGSKFSRCATDGSG